MCTSELRIVMMNMIPYYSDMMGYLFRKRKRFPYKTRNSLPHQAVMTFYRGCFVNRAMSFRWKNFPIGNPEICMADSALTINTGKRIPKTLCSRLITTAGIKTRYLLCVNIFCLPYPNFICFASAKFCKHLI